MSKKRPTSETQDDDGHYKVPKDGMRRDEVNNGDSQYEDPWEDEFDSEEEHENEDEGEQSDDDQKMEVDYPTGVEEIATPFILGVDSISEGDTLEADDSAYVMRHALKIGWSCLSFDILRDNLGDERQRLPTTAYVVAGSQADRPENNTVSVFKLSSLHRTQTHEDSDDSDDSDDEALDEDPVVEQQAIPHMGTVNRVRAQRLSTPVLPSVTQPYYTAVWSDIGKVSIYNVRPLIEALDVPGYNLDKRSCQHPCFTIDSHGVEGYAMDWNSPTASSLSLITGDNDSNIYLTTTGNADFRTFPKPFQSHESSVEDLQWSPTEITVFASCSSDRTIRMWDIRSKARQSVTSIDAAHDSDVNVISWNRSASYLLVSGDDEGQVKVWDLRNIKQSQAQVARFDWHKGPITSIEWHPTDDSVFTASSDDHQVTLWDLAVEQDEDTMASNDVPNLPPQLLFPHYQENAKEVHWHPQIPGAIISTGIDSLNVFKTIAA